MARIRPHLGALLAAILASVPAVAQPPALADPDARIVDAFSGPAVRPLLVRPAQPAWWMVSNGSRTVHVLGVLWEFPAEQVWNQRQLNTRLRGVTFVLLPPVVIDRQARTPLQSGSGIPKEMQARFKQAALSIGQDPARYETLNPVTAGQLLISDFRNRLGLRPEAIVADVVRAATARDRDLRFAARLGDYSADRVRQTSPEGAAACLEAALDEVEGGAAPVKTAVDGWMSGDVRRALQAPRGFERCSLAISGYLALRETAVSAQVLTIRAHLDSRNAGAGDVVAVVELRSLLAEDGVLSRLERLGFKITPPEGADL